MLISSNNSLQISDFSGVCFRRTRVHNDILFLKTLKKKPSFVHKNSGKRKGPLLIRGVVDWVMEADDYLIYKMLISPQDATFMSNQIKAASNMNLLID